MATGNISKYIKHTQTDYFRRRWFGGQCQDKYQAIFKHTQKINKETSNCRHTDNTFLTEEEAEEEEEEEREENLL